MSSYDEHLISMAGGDGDPLDQIRRRADDPFGTMKLGIGQVDADRDALLVIVRRQAATIANVLTLANSAGRCGWKLSADEVRKALKG